MKRRADELREDDVIRATLTLPELGLELPWLLRVTGLTVGTWHGDEFQAAGAAAAGSVVRLTFESSDGGEGVIDLDGDDELDLYAEGT